MLHNNHQSNSNQGIELRSKLRPFAGRPDLTSMVDVLFLLLIFFMLSSSFVQVSGIMVDLPSTSAVTKAGLEKFIVTIELEGENGYNLYFRDRPVDWEGLKEELTKVSARSGEEGKAADAGESLSTIVIRADRNVPLWVALEVESLAANCRLSSFIITLPPEAAAPEVFE